MISITLFFDILINGIKLDILTTTNIITNIYNITVGLNTIGFTL